MPFSLAEKIPGPHLPAPPGAGAAQTHQDRRRWDDGAGVWGVANDTIAGREGKLNCGEA